tara:strand:- start:50498 stop:51469 length:972 start_codon:yes stop_codon:yes gene_type:complete
MKLDLTQFWRQSQLMSIYLISSDEPLLKQEAAQRLRELASEQGFNERKTFDVGTGFNWQVLCDEANSMSLFSEKCLLELRLGDKKAGTPGSKAIQEYIANMPTDKILLITCNKLDAASSKSKWVKAIESNGAWLPIWPLEGAQLQRWISQRLKTANLTTDNAGLNLLAEQTEGNLLACAQEIEKLSLLHEGDISADDIRHAISNNARYDVFDLSDAWLQSDNKRFSTVLRRLQEEGTEPTLVLWALARDCQQLTQIAAAGGSESSMRQFGVWQKRMPLIKQHLSQHTLSDYSSYLKQIAQIDKLSKGLAKGNVWDAFENLLSV